MIARGGGPSLGRVALDLSTPEFAAARRRLSARFGAAAIEPWWAALAPQLEGFAERWALTLEAPVGHGETAVVLPATGHGGDRLFLKVTPEPALSEAEARALDHWATTGRVPHVVDRETAVGALLLEALPTETPLRLTGGVPSLEAVAALAADLHDAPPAPGEFPPLAERVRFLFDRWEQQLAADPTLAAVVGPARLAPGRLLAQELAGAPGLALLVHGDLHPGNVFDVGGKVGLMTLDPRPCVGDQAFDLIDWILWRTDVPDEWRLRTNALAELAGLDAERTWAWCAAFAALLAALELARGGSPTRVAALLSIAA